jgi:intracellular sulfur oxidation DsrE/DsrF family protein
MKKLSLLIVFLSLFANAQELQKGTIIKNYGLFYNIQNPDKNLNPDKEYSVIFDIRKTSNDINAVNPLLDIVARFINMHIAQGVPQKNLHLVVVMHGGASKDVLSNTAYKERFRKKNPNLDLLKELKKNDVEIFVCGQSALHRGIKREEVCKPVKFALSALTVLTDYQSLGYQIIDFN